MECPKEFDDIRPFYDSEFHDKMKVLVTEPGFEHAVRYVLRDINYELFCQELLTIDNKKDFQLLVMRSFLEGLTQKTTKGLTGNNLDVLDKAKSYTFMSNHRDIVLDASLLNLLLIRNGIKTSEIAIGNNLLIYDWISDLVRLNKSFSANCSMVRSGLSICSSMYAITFFINCSSYGVICGCEGVRGSGEEVFFPSISLFI